MLEEAAINKVLYSRFKVQTFIPIYIFFGVADRLTTIGTINSVTASYWVENLDFLLDVSIKSMRGFKRYRVIIDIERKNWQKNTCRKAAFL